MKKRKNIDSISPKEWDEASKTFVKNGKTEDFDPVNRPPHYNQGTMEAIDYIKQQLGPIGYRAYCEGTAIKYLHRYKYKQQNIQDLEKCIWYLNRLKNELQDM
jgi:hypothetical protein|tara:strand:- start:132 stop:440 length:309 start_codon:yes stop_codon:yes gene_type:complete